MIGARGDLGQFKFKKFVSLLGNLIGKGVYVLSFMVFYWNLKFHHFEEFVLFRGHILAISWFGLGCLVAGLCLLCNGNELFSRVVILNCNGNEYGIIWWGEYLFDLWCLILHGFCYLVNVVGCFFCLRYMQFGCCFGSFCCGK